MTKNRHWAIPVTVLAALICGAALGYGVQQATNSSRSGSTLPKQATPPGNPSTAAGMSAQEAQAEAGLESPWDVRKILANIVSEDQQFKPLLAELTPQQWYDKKGAPSTYILQWQTAQQQLNDMVYSTRQLSQKTDSLSLALDTYFRAEALDVTLRSLQQGAEKYAARGVADRLNEVIAHNFNDRERFRDYIRDLATSTEQNFKIADEEAQRCRGMISREPAPVSKRVKH